MIAELPMEQNAPFLERFACPELQGIRRDQILDMIGGEESVPISLSIGRLLQELFLLVPGKRPLVEKLESFKH